ncbi:TPA: ABC transporter substrate-binding protein, partial [Klebsiella pneumoniae]|nr:ABC transporter substrate-binding protein [Klebsiella pneumoniae]
MYKKISGLVVSLTAVFACAAWAEMPAGYPADYQKTVDAAVKEG